MTLEGLDKSLNYIGNACGKISEDIVYLHKNPEDVLFVVPFRGGLPIWKGISYGFHKIMKDRGEGSYEESVIYLPASSIVKDRDTFIEESIHATMKKEYGRRKYEAIAVVDEAASGSCSKMVFDNVKKGVMDYSEDRDWKRFYWRTLPVELYILVGNSGRLLNPRIQKLSNVFHYPIEGKIITFDNDEIYPISYITEVGRKISKRDGKIYKIVEPDVMFEENKLWDNVLKEIEKGVDEYFEVRKLEKIIKDESCQNFEVSDKKGV